LKTDSSVEDPGAVDEERIHAIGRIVATTGIFLERIKAGGGVVGTAGIA